MENQEANELTQITFGYKVLKPRITDIIKIQEKMVSNIPSLPYMEIPKTRGEEDSDGSFSCDNSFSSGKCLENFEFNFFARHEVLAIENLSQSDWRIPIIEYLENPVRNTDMKIKYKALSYILLGN